MKDDDGADIASRLRACRRRWELGGGSRLDGGFRSDVFAYTTARGDSVVVKLTTPSEGASAEAAALAARAHTGAAARLIDVNTEACALLLDRIQPGTRLPGGDDPVAVQVASDLLTRLHRASPGTFPFPALEQIYSHLEDQAREGAGYERRTRGDPMRAAAGLQRLDAARSAAMTLCDSAGQTVLLHGDFFDKNLLWDGAGYVAIDPMPRIGDPCADVGFFAAGHPPATAILPRAAAIAGHMGLDRRRAQRWAAVWTVLQTCHAWRDDQADLEASLSSDDFSSLLTH
jgi:streptomycin 6-kinase